MHSSWVSSINMLLQLNNFIKGCNANKAIRFAQFLSYFFSVSIALLATTSSPIKSANAANDIDKTDSTRQIVSDTMGNTYELSWIDPSIPVKADLLCIHGLGLCAKGYESFGQHMAAKGIATYALNVRGFGVKSLGNHRPTLDLDKSVLDVRDILTSIHSKNPNRPIFLLGESMGGSIAIKTASLYPDSMNGLICSAPAWHIFKKKRTAFKGLLSLAFPRHDKVGFATMSVLKEATSKRELQEHWLEDHDHRFDFTAHEVLSFMKFIAHTPGNARRIDRTPVLIVQGLHDHLVKPSGAANLFQKLKTVNKTFAIDGNAEHVIFEEGQFSDEDLELLTSWIQQISPSQAKVSNINLGPNGVLLGHSHFTEKEKKAADKLFNQAGIQPDDNKCQVVNKAFK